MPPRPRYVMPEFMREALGSRGVMATYRARLSRALRGVPRISSVYMKMAWRSKEN